MGKVVWTPDNDRKLLIRLIDKSAKSYNSEALSLLFPGATPKAIEERIAKLKREAKALDNAVGIPPSPSGAGQAGKGGNIYTKTPATGSHVPSNTLKRFRKEAAAVDDEEYGAGEDEKRGKNNNKNKNKKPRAGAAAPPPLTPKSAMKKLRLDDGLEKKLPMGHVSFKRDEGAY